MAKLKTVNWWMRNWAGWLRFVGAWAGAVASSPLEDAAKCRDELGDAARDLLAAKNRYEAALRNLEKGT